MSTSTAQTHKKYHLLPDTKIRCLKLEHWRRLGEILTINNRWQDVASKITKSCSDDFLFSPADIDALEAQSKHGASPAEAFLDHWGTSLKNQPTIQVLVDLLMKLELYQAADTVSREFLGDPIFLDDDVAGIKTDDIYTDLEKKLHMNDHDLCPKDGTARNLELDNFSSADKTIKTPSTLGVCDTNENQMSNKIAANDATDYEGNQKIEAFKIPRSCVLYKYSDLAHATENFCNVSIYRGGCKIGEGAYGTVYRAYYQRKWVAIKKLNGSVDKQFFTELEVLSKYKHENLLPLLGYSSDGPYCCLVYEYVKNGCLQERLACVGGTPPIPWNKRIAIAYYTACGINYLHTFGPKPLVHRDIKSANVLLDERLMPKVGDFGLARVGSSGGSSTIALTSKVCGTHIYMPCEAFRGEVTIKLDSFSYGVVLMEILTGLAPYDTTRKEADLISFMEENCCEILDIVGLLDSRAGQWDQNIAIPLYEISRSCTEIRSKDRPKISEVLPRLKELLDITVSS